MHQIICGKKLKNKEKSNLILKMTGVEKIFEKSTTNLLVTDAPLPLERRKKKKVMMRTSKEKKRQEWRHSSKKWLISASRENISNPLF